MRERWSRWRDGEEGVRGGVRDRQRRWKEGDERDRGRKEGMETGRERRCDGKETRMMKETRSRLDPSPTVNNFSASLPVVTPC